MKLKLAVCIASLFSASAFAQPFFIDINDDRGGNSNPTANGPTSTGWLDELQFIYNSWSTVFDTDASVTISSGDIITSTGGILGSGFNMSLISDNVFSALLPTQTGGGPSRNGYGDTWGMTFGFDNLVGTIQDADGNIQWTSGTISMYYYEDADLVGCAAILSCVTKMFDMNVTSGGNIPSGMVINGYMNNFNNVDTVNGVSAGSLFYTDKGGIDSFDNIYNDLFAAGYEFSLNFRVDQNASTFPAVTGYAGQTFTLARARHDGSLSFSVPEPASLAVLGLGLLGLGVSSRRKAKN